MSEGPQPGTARRGRRDPALAQRIAVEAPLEEDEFENNDAGELSPVEPRSMYPGDVVGLKGTAQFKSVDLDTWWAVDLKTHVQPDEDGPDAIARLADLATEGILHAAYNAEEAVAQARHEFATRRIVPRKTNVPTTQNRD